MNNKGIYFYNPGNHSTIDLFRRTVRMSSLKEARFIVAIGGDGTFLEAFQEISRVSFPGYHVLMGLNRGHVGFLTCPYSVGVSEEYLDLYFSDYHDKYVYNRHYLAVRYRYALNDVVYKAVDGKIGRLKVNIGSNPITYRGDGLIISTATGSTAYNMSCGGPILTPNEKVVVVTPISPYTMAARPIVTTEDLAVEAVTPHDVYVDGKYVYRLDTGESDRNIHLVGSIPTLLSESFFSMLTKKLHWNKEVI